MGHAKSRVVAACRDSQCHGLRAVHLLGKDTGGEQDETWCKRVKLNQALFDKEKRQPSVSFFAGNRKKTVSLELVCFVCVCVFYFLWGEIWGSLPVCRYWCPQSPIHISQFSRWQQLKHFFGIFTPFLGEMIQFGQYVSNHQLIFICLLGINLLVQHGSAGSTMGTVLRTWIWLELCAKEQKLFHVCMDFLVMCLENGMPIWK